LKKKILLICHSSEKSGGGEDDFLRIIKFLKDKHETFGAFPHGPRENIFSQYVNEHFYMSNKHFPLMGLNIRYFISRSYIKNFFQTVFALRGFIKKNKDLNLVILNSSVCYIEALVLSYYKVPYIIFLREKLNPHNFRKFIYKLYNKHAYKIIAVSEYLKDIFLKYEYSDKIEVLNAPIEENFYEKVRLEFSKSSSDKKNDIFIITQIGAVGILKSQETTLKALRELKGKKIIADKKILLKLIGKFQNDDYYKNLLQLGKSLPENMEVEFTGEISKEDLIRNLLITDCIVIASKEEGASLVFSEGLFLEIPVIATNVADLPKMIDNYNNGLIYEKGDFMKLSEYIYEMITNEELRNRIKENSRSTYSKYFNLNENLLKLEKIIQSI